VLTSTTAAIVPVVAEYSQKYPMIASYYSSVIAPREGLVKLWQSSHPVGESIDLNTEVLAGDVGAYDHSSVIAMLQRKLKRILVVESSRSKTIFSDKYDFCKEKTWDSYYTTGLIPPGIQVGTIMLQLFSETAFREHVNDRSLDAKVDKPTQVFFADDLPSVLCKFQRARLSGKPIVVETTLQVRGNAAHGVQEYGPVRVLWLVIDVYPDWFNRLDTETQAYMADVWTDHHSFPSSIPARLPHVGYNNPMDLSALVSLVQDMVRDSSDVVRTFIER